MAYRFGSSRTQNQLYFPCGTYHLKQLRYWRKMIKILPLRIVLSVQKTTRRSQKSAVISNRLSPKVWLRISQRSGPCLPSVKLSWRKNKKCNNSKWRMKSWRRIRLMTRCLIIRRAPPALPSMTAAGSWRWWRWLLPIVSLILQMTPWMKNKAMPVYPPTPRVIVRVSASTQNL